jgi:hypothetical protein
MTRELLPGENVFSRDLRSFLPAGKFSPETSGAFSQQESFLPRSPELSPGRKVFSRDLRSFLPARKFSPETTGAGLAVHGDRPWFLLGSSTCSVGMPA